MQTCSHCGDPMPEGVDCHHHNTDTDYDEAGNIVVQCQDCPEWWVLTPEVP